MVLHKLEVVLSRQKYESLSKFYVSASVLTSLEHRRCTFAPDSVDSVLFYERAVYSIIHMLEENEQLFPKRGAC